MKAESMFPHLKYPHTQVIYFDNGERREVYGITGVHQGKWTHILCGGDGHQSRELIVNPDRVLFIQIKEEGK